MDSYINNINLFRLFSLSLLLGAIFIPFLQSKTKPKSPRKAQEFIFFAVSMLALLVWRGPSLLINTQINVDESFIIANAMALWNDPIPWRSVNPTTSGPLNIFVQMWPYLFGSMPSYFSLRLTTAGLILIILISLRRFAASIIPYELSYMAILPLIFFFCLSAEQDFIQASTEYFSVALISLAFVLGLQIWNGAANLWRCFFAGLLLGAVSMAKLQAVPIAGVVGLFFFALAIIANRYVVALILIAGAATLPIVVSLVVFWAGAINEMWIRYIAQNIFYSAPHKTQLGNFEIFQRLFQSSQYFTVYCSGAFGCFVFSASLYIKQILGLKLKNQKDTQSEVQVSESQLPKKKKRGDKDLHKDFLTNSIASQDLSVFCKKRSVVLKICVVLCALASFYSMVRSGYIFPHYLILLIFPVAVAFLLAAAFLCKHGGNLLLVSSIVFASSFQIFFWIVNEDPYKNFLIAISSKIDFRDDLTKFISEKLEPWDRLGIWGHSIKYYADAKALPATRDVDTIFMMFSNNPYTEHLIDVYFNDLEKSKPKFFIDTASDINNFHNLIPIERRRHNNFPKIKEFIQKHYDKVAEFEKQGQDPYWLYKLKTP